MRVKKTIPKIIKNCKQMGLTQQDILIVKINSINKKT